MTWQLIETALKDGQPMLLCGGVYHGLPFPGRFEPSDFFPDRPWRNLLDLNRLYEHSPTHWMPLPDPPGVVI